MKRFYLIVLVTSSFQLMAQQLPFQGRLLEEGRPFTGTATFVFSIADPAWSETLSNVNVQDGYYSVVLGGTNPMPKVLYTDGKADLNISVNTTALSPVTLHASPLPDSAYTHHIATLGVNGNEKSILSTTNNGYDALFMMKDSLDRTGGHMLTRKTGGYLQLNQRDFATGQITAAAATGTTGDQNSFLRLYGGNATGDGPQLMIDLYSSTLDVDGNVRPDGYRRGGLDIYNYNGTPTHFIFSEPGGGNIILNDGTGNPAIFLNGETGTIEAQELLIQGTPVGNSLRSDTLKAGSVQLFSPTQELKADLNYFAANDGGSLVLYGNNNSRTVILGSSGNTGGETGFLGLYDTNDMAKVNVRVDTLQGGGQDHGKILLWNTDYSKRILLDGSSSTIEVDKVESGQVTLKNNDGNEAAYFSGTATGATLQLSNPDVSNSFSTSTFFAGTTTNGQNAFMNVYGMNPTGDGQSLLINGYTTSSDIFGTPFTNGYRRGGIDIYDNEGGDFMVALGINRDENGADPTGKTGIMSLNGTTSRNVFLGGKFWENHNLGVMQVFGQDASAPGDFISNIQLEALAGGGAFIGMGNSTGTGLYNEIILLNTKDGTDGGGFVAINNAAGDQKISLDGGSGNISGNTLTSSDGTVQTSDRRFKKDIRQLQNALSNVQKLRGVSYKWKDENKSQRNQVGVIAQEIEEVYPEFVHTDKDGYKAVNYAQMTAVLIEAVKELSAKVETLEAENRQFEEQAASIEQLEKQFAQLKAMFVNEKVASK